MSSLLLLVSALAASASAGESLRLTEGRPLGYVMDLSVAADLASFDGRETLRVALDRSSKSLRLNAEDLEIGAVTLRAGDKSQPVTVSPDGDGFIKLRWASAVKGEVVFDLAWKAKISSLDTDGTFVQREGDDSYLFTQMEPRSARRVFPGFDQPEFKTPYQLTLHLPAGMDGYSNSPGFSTTTENGTVTTVFAATAPLPSYLFAFAAGPFDVVPAGDVDGVPVRILVPRGRAADAAWAAEITAPITKDLQDYTGVPYPYAKLDIVSLPKPVGWGAMENAGLITMEQGWLIARAEDDSLARRRDCAEVLAHEIAHQWTGDLVTPEWWDDLWLNESFASWLATKIVNARWPEWQMEVARAGYLEDARQADSLLSARRVREPIAVEDDIEGAFDAITYQKGEAVLTMVERWVGADVFQRGLKRYLTEHAHGVATAADFFAAESAEAGHDLAPVFESFLDQGGVPELSIACNKGVTGSIVVSQARSLPTGPERGRWLLPVRMRYPTPEGSRTTTALITKKKQVIPLSGAAGCPSWVVPNVEQTGYYRVVYSEETLNTLLSADEPGLSEVERIGVVQDGAALLAQGRLAPTALLSQIPGLLALGDRALTGSTVGVVEALDRNLVPDDLRGAYRGFILKNYGPLAAELGHAGVSGEPDAARSLRPRVLGLVGLQGADPALSATMDPLAVGWLAGQPGLDPDLVPVALAIKGVDGGMPWFEALRDRVLVETDRERRGHILDAMGALRDPAALGAALSFVTGGAVDVREAIGVFIGALAHPDTAQVLWDFTEKNLDQLEELLPAAARGYLVMLGSGFCDEAHAVQVEDFFRPRVGRWVGGPRLLDQTLEGVRQCDAGRQAQAPGVRVFLEGAGG